MHEPTIREISEQRKTKNSNEEVMPRAALSMEKGRVLQNHTKKTPFVKITQLVKQTNFL